MKEGKAMKEKIVYFIAYYGSDRSMAWDDDKKRFVPACMKLYRTAYENIDDALKKCREVKKKYASGWADDIFVDGEIKYI